MKNIVNHCKINTNIYICIKNIGKTMKTYKNIANHCKINTNIQRIITKTIKTYEKIVNHCKINTNIYIYIYI